MRLDSIVTILDLREMFLQVFAQNQVTPQGNTRDDAFPDVPNGDSTVVARGQLFPRTSHHRVHYALNTEIFPTV
jgi:hypothetical protein